MSSTPSPPHLDPATSETNRVIHSEASRQTMTTLIFQLGGTALTVIGLTFTMSQPLFNKLDALNLTMTRVEAQTTASDIQQAAMERRLSRIENDLYILDRAGAAKQNAIK